MRKTLVLVRVAYQRGKKILLSERPIVFDIRDLDPATINTPQSRLLASLPDGYQMEVAGFDDPERGQK